MQIRYSFRMSRVLTPRSALPGRLSSACQPQVARRTVFARTMKPEINTDDTPGIDTLLARDRKEIELVEGAFGPDPPAARQQQAAPSDKPGAAAEDAAAAAAVAAGKQRRAELRDEPSAPRRSREAIDAGLQLFQQGQFPEAADLFQLALELPGSGTFRMGGSPKEYACASEGEENTALYNMACCWCKMGKPDSALTCLEALVENGFDDYSALRTDPDLTPARGPRLESLLAQRDGLLGKLFGGKTKKGSGGDKPWIQW